MIVRVAKHGHKRFFGRVNHGNTPGEALESVSDVVQSVAVLIRAGIPPPSVWTYLAEAPRDTRNGESARARTRRGCTRDESVELAVWEVIRRIAAAEEGHTSDVIAASASHVPARESTAWRALACVWQVADRSGAPVADCLVSLADSLRSLAETEREIDVALAGPLSTVRLISALPLVAIALGWCLGLDAPKVLVTTSIGAVCAGAGVALWCVGVAWGRHLIGRVQAVRPLVGFELDLAAVATVGEASHPSACAVANEALARFGLAGAGEINDSRGVFELAAGAGIPAQSLLRARADQARRRDRHRSRRAIAKLEVSLVLPIGLCIMPAFIALGIVPVVLSIFLSTVAELAG